MEHIVVGVDESSSAGDALRWALRERSVRDGKLSAVLVWTYLAQHHGLGDGVFQRDYDEEAAAAALERIVVAAAPGEADTVERLVVCDLPARGLLEASSGADLLVVGSRGLGGFRGLLLGSVSQQCAQHSTVPVAIVRWSQEAARHERIVVGVDGSPGSRRALDWALDEARARHGPVTIVYAWEPPEMPMGGLASAPYDEMSAEAEARRLVDDLLDGADVSDLTGPVDIFVTRGSAVEAILGVSETASLVVVGTRGRGGFHGLLLGSVSQHVIHHAECPVVVVPPAG